MKQSDLINLLKKYLNTEVRKIVREEVNYSVNNVRNIIREEIELLGQLNYSNENKLNYSEDIHNTNFSNDEDSYDSLIGSENNNNKLKEIKSMKFSNDPMLDNILKETAAHHKPISNDAKPPVEYRQMGSVMTSKNVNPSNPPNLKASPAGSTTNEKGVKRVEEILPDDRKHREIPDFLQDVLTRDYSELTKAMSKPKTGPSSIPPGMSPM